MVEHSIAPTAAAPTAPPGAPSKRPGDAFAVHLMTARAPAWAGQPGLHCSAIDGVHVLPAGAADGPSIVLMDAAVFDAPDRAWVAEITDALGPVAVVADGPEDAAHALASGVRAALPMSFLDAPADLARALLLELLTPAPPAPGHGLVRYTRDALHEFRTPLTVVMEFASLCLDGVGGELSEKHREYVAHVEGAARRLGEQLDDFRDTLLLRFGHHGRGLAGLPLVDAVERATEAFDGEVEVRIGPGARGRPLALDAARLSTGLERILDAASKWSRGGEPVRVEVASDASRADACRVEVAYAGLRPSGEDVRTMRDGLVETEHGVYRSVARVFGLGVAMARAFIEAEGGTVRLEATETGGVYALTLPCQGAPEAARPIR